MHELSILIKSRRNLFGLSQVALAQASRISLPTIQNLEAGKGNPSLLILEPLLAALGMKLEVTHCPTNWDLLANLGVPIFSQSPRVRSKRITSQNATDSPSPSAQACGAGDSRIE
jgi:transcriptional regulator with XRE-family HTH domain